MKSKTLTITIPERKRRQRPIERLKDLANRRNRSISYLVIEAIMKYLEREEMEGNSCSGEG